MNIFKAVGNTPLLRLSGLPCRQDVRIYGKAEFLNISGSVKDRAAKGMILDGQRRGLLRKGMTIIDATSGNTGIAFARIGAALHFDVKLCMPENVSVERIKMMEAYGAEIVRTSALEGNEGAYEAVRKIVESDPEKYFYPDQYTNEENWKAHFHGTGEEIIRQTNGEITHFAACTGTAGTFVGCTRKLREFNPEIKCVAVTPDSPFHGIEGVKHYSAILKTGFYDPSLPDEQVEVSTEEAYYQTRRLAREEGIFVGISSGANIAAALKIAENAPPNSVIVTILCDAGSRYLSGRVWRSDYD